MTRSEQLFALAQQLIPGGVNSPVRAFGSVGGTPRFIQEAKGSSIKDVDGNQYIDFVGSWGPMIFRTQSSRDMQRCDRNSKKRIELWRGNGIGSTNG